MEKAKAVEVLNGVYDRAVWLREIRSNSSYLNLDDLLIALLTAIDALEQDK